MTGRDLGTVVGGVALAVSAVVTVSTRVPTASRVPALLATTGTLAVLGYVVALVLLALSRRRVAALLALAGLLLHVVWLVPSFVGTGRPVASADLTVMTANLEYGRGDASSVVGAVAERGVDVLVLEEVTPQVLRRLRADGLDRLLPRSAGQPAETASGTMVFSRYALGRATRVPLSQGGLAVSVAAPEPFLLVGAHASEPLFRPTQWSRDLALLQRVASRAARSGPVLVAGDLNTTPDHPYFRRLLGAAELEDAAQQAGSGVVPTWPVRAGLPRLITIDHVLTGPAYAAVRTTRVAVPGSDHRGLVADLASTSP